VQEALPVGCGAVARAYDRKSRQRAHVAARDPSHNPPRRRSGALVRAARKLGLGIGAPGASDSAPAMPPEPPVMPADRARRGRLSASIGPLWTIRASHVARCPRLRFVSARHCATATAALLHDVLSERPLTAHA